jgi:hypothetical protein
MKLATNKETLLKKKKKEPIEYGSSPLILIQTDKHPKILNVFNFVTD